VALAVETQGNPAVKKTFALQTLADARFCEKLHGIALEDAGADALLDVFARARFEDHRFNAHAVQEMREHQTCRSGADDSDLSRLG
jgi:hypothetical protein